MGGEGMDRRMDGEVMASLCNTDRKFVPKDYM